MGIAAVLDEVADVGEDFAVLGDAGGEGGAVDDEAEGFALGEGAEVELEVEGTGRVAVSGEDGGVEEQAVLGGYLGGFEGEETGGHVGRGDLELVRGDDERVALFGLGVEGAGAGEGEGVALGLEGTFVGREERVGTGDGCVQVDAVSVGGALPVSAEILPGELDVEVLVGERHLEGRDGRAGDEEVHRRTAVGDSLADGEKVEDVGLDGLWEAFDAEDCLPVRVGDAEGGLDAGELAGEEGGGDVGEAGGAVGGETQAWVRGDGDVAAGGAGLEDFDAGQGPVGQRERRVPFEAELDELPVGDGLGVDKAEFGIGFAGGFADEVVGESLRGESGDGESAGDPDEDFAKRGFSDVEFELGFSGGLGLAQMVGEDLRDADLGLDVVGLDAQGVFSAGESVDEALRGGGREKGAGAVRLGELFGSDLGEAGGADHFEADGTVVDDAEVAGEAGGALGTDLDGVDGLGEGR